jgi:hypothetical protein
MGLFTLRLEYKRKGTTEVSFERQGGALPFNKHKTLYESVDTAKGLVLILVNEDTSTA